jgi:opacity protein-like surface antigen
VNIFNGEVGYRFSNGWRVQIDALNLLNSTTYNASYAYGALLTTDALFAKCFPTPKIAVAVCQNGFMDYSIHPIEPMAFRLTLAGPLDTIDVYAMAAEFGRAVPAFAPPSAHFDWTGFYVGGYGEYSWANTNGSTVNLATGAPATAVTGNPPNWHGGIQLGFDYMMPSRLLIGVAADVTSGGTRTTTVTDSFGTSANQTTVFDSETIRGRVGYLRQRPPLRNGGVGLVEQSIRSYPACGHAQQRHCGRGRGGEHVSQRVDGGRRRCRRCRAELERIRRVSIHELRIHGVYAAAVGAVDDFGNEGRRH